MRKSKDTKLTKFNRQGNSSNTYLLVQKTFMLHTCQFEFTPNILIEVHNVLVSSIYQSSIKNLTIGTIHHSFLPNVRNSVSLSHCWNIILCVGKLTHMNILSSHHFKGKESSDHGLPNKDLNPTYFPKYSPSLV